MFCTIAEFEKAWKYESEATLKLLGALTDASLSQAVSPADRTLGRIAWHITTSIPEMMERTGLKLTGPEPSAPVPSTSEEITAAYATASRSLLEQIRERWSDASLDIEDEMYGEHWKRGYTVTVLLNHQTHHRGQMTVLMRQAGLRVPGVYGPAREEWSGFGMEAPAV